jgi:amino acid adenylation domain-containing protein
VAIEDQQIAELDPFAGGAITAMVASTEPQREVWTATQIGTDASLAFNESASIRLRGVLDVEALRAALGDVVARHEALRSTFSADGLTMLVGEAPRVELPVHDWSTSGDEERAARLRALTTAAVEEPFDLVSGPLVRFALVRLGAEEHVLVITAHHIVCDGWSFGVIGGELAALYTARREGTEAPLGPPDLFSDYARELQAGGAEAERTEAEGYWVRQFAGGVPVLDLPGDRPRPPAKTYAAAREDRLLSADLTRRVKAAGARGGASPFATLLSAFAALMHRLSGQDDLVVGIPSAGQAASGRSGLVGHCVNMLPLRMRVRGAMPFAELLASARTTVLDAQDHQQITFGSLLTLLPIVRDPSRLPLVSVIFNLDRAVTADAMPFAGLHAELASNPRTYENFDLFLNAVEVDGALSLECQYNTDLFDGATVRRWLESYELLLDGITREPQAEVGALPMLTGADRDAIARCNDTAQPHGSARRVHELVEEQAARTPAAVAVEFDGHAISYGELNARANQLARRLRALGVRRDVLVGLCVERSIEMVVAVLAVLKAGGGYVPLDPGYPADRLAFMAEDAQLAVLITESRVRNELTLPAADVVLVDGDAAAIAAESAENLAADADAAGAESPAYVSYTSGSTGRPKGVLVPHAAVVNLLEGARAVFGVSADDVVLAITTLSFDIAVSEVILPLTVGARVALASRDVAADGLALARLIERAGVTFIDATPATYRLLLGAGWAGGPRLRLICTAEAMPRDLGEALCARAAVVWNAYGPTETTVWSTVYRVTPPVGRILIGRPIANTQTYVLDAQMRPVPVGVKGELYIGGEGVTNGYLNRPELTSERFIADRFGGAEGARLYRTGDVVRLLADGNLECLGRNDNQVKVRGFRIELGEIEDTLLKHPAVQQAAVIAREDAPGDVRLVAYVVIGAGAAPTDGDLRAFAKQTLPDYMVPQAVVRLDTLPLTPSGKIDRKALPAPQGGARSADEEFVEPRTETERMLAGLWAAALGMGRVGVRDDFFALGGHSLLASQILSRLRRDHGVELSFRKVFEAPTIERLAAVIDAQQAGPDAPRVPPIPRLGASSAPLSVVQERLWMLEELEPAQVAAHSLGAAWRLAGPLDADALERAINRFVARHEAVRTTFHEVSGERRQVVAPELWIPLVRRDRPASSPEEVTRVVDEVASAAQDVPFDLAAGPLLRAELVRFGPNDHLLYTLRHALIWDGWSFDIFVREFTEAYAAEVEGRAPVLPELGIGYSDFAAWQREWLAGPEAARQKEWWQAQLAGEVPVLELPTDRPRPARPSREGDRRVVKFSVDEREALRALARQHDATLYMILFAGYNVLLHRYSGQSDIIVGSPVRARTRTETEDVVGPFVNTVLLRTRIDADATFAALLQQVRDVTLDAFSHQEMPFELLGMDVPVLRALFSMQDARERPVRAGKLDVRQIHEPQRGAANDLMLWTMEQRDGMLAVLNYSSELFDGATAQRFLEQLRTLLLSLLREPSQTVGAAEILAADERATLLAAGAPRVTVGARSAPSQFAERAAASGGAPAVSGVESLGYAAVADRSARVAGALRAAGVAPGATVAVCVAGAAGRLVASLGVMRAGAAVLLVDADDPAAYRAALLDGAAAAVVDSLGREAIREASGVPVLALDAAQRSAPLADAAATDAAGPAVMLHAPAADGIARTTVSHAALAALLDDVRTRLGVGAGDVLMACLAPDADAAVIELLLPATSGARLVAAPDEARASGADLARVLDATGATVMIAPFSTWRLLLDAGWSAPAAFRAVVIGVPVPVRVLGELRRRVGRLFTAYGDATMGIWAALHEVTGDDPRVLVGQPAGSARLLVLTGAGALAPLGVPGVLHVETDATGGGSAAAAALDGVARPGARLVRTRDRARCLADGNFELARVDAESVWMDGARVELAAIDRALAGHAAVVEAAVAAHDDDSGTTRLVAHLVMARGADYTDSELRAAVRKVLPRRLVPQLFVEMDALPRAAGGAVDRARLASPYAADGGAGEYVAPRTPAEQLLAGAWREALGVERVGLQDNFFALGGSSLLCFRVVERLQREHAARISPRAMLVGTLEQAASQLVVAAPASAPAAPAAAPTGGGLGMVRKLKDLITGSR